MKIHAVVALALTLGLAAAPACASTVEEFLATAATLPHNASAMLRPDALRLISEVRGAGRTIRAEQAAARRAGRRPATCVPDRVDLRPSQVYARFNAIPPARRNISVTQAMREWMAERYPCPN